MAPSRASASIRSCVASANLAWASSVRAISTRTDGAELLELRLDVRDRSSSSMAGVAIFGAAPDDEVTEGNVGVMSAEELICK